MTVAEGHEWHLWIEARDAAKHLTMNREVSSNEE